MERAWTCRAPMPFSSDLRMKPSRLELPYAPHGDIRFNGKGQDEALELAVFRDQPDAEVLGMPGIANRRGLAAQEDLVPARLVGAVDGPDDLGAARADEADEAQDLALVKLEGDVVELVGADRTDLHHDLAHAVGARGVLVLDRAADHLGDQLVPRELGHGLGVHHAAVPHHAHDVAELEDLVQLVADVDDRDPLLLELVDDRDQLGHLLRR